MKALKGILPALILITGYFTVSAQTFDFRKVNWGTSMSDVKNTEQAKITSETVTRIIYEGKLGADEAKVIYIFTTADKLMRAKYVLAPDYFNMIFYIRDFKMLEQALTKRYGAAIAVTPKAIDKPAIKEEEWASYLSAGELMIEATWSTPKTDIMLTLSKIGGNPGIQIDYISKEQNKLDVSERVSKLAKEL